MGKVKVRKENSTGRNTNFQDTSNGKNMTRSQFVKEIENGNYNDYYVRNINRVKTLVSNPNGKKDDNLG
ncbi:DUF3892 domain-containing protein [Fusobacterium necrophorum]|uniref:DUF3892 domain-containing protein n=2 Tax=Fusobacterium TaxID=848 RepID=UPI00370EE855